MEVFLETDDRFMFPSFELVNWYAAACLLKLFTGFFLLYSLASFLLLSIGSFICALQRVIPDIDLAFSFFSETDNIPISCCFIAEEKEIS